MALGREDRQGRFDDVLLLVGDQLVQGSLYRLLAEHGDALFGDEYFADLFKRSTLGCPTVPARVVATVMLLQAYEGAQAPFCVGYRPAAFGVDHAWGKFAVKVGGGHATVHEEVTAGDERRHRGP